ncbi:MAG: DUF2079 domain-containing protein [Chloroflexi bacterium]|nr:DUF2079 domain-containing protein [Chloroflexota bacterium]
MVGKGESSFRRTWLILFLLIAAYIGYLSFLSILRYETFFAASGDFARRGQIMWNTLQGKPFVFTTWGSEMSLLGYHTEFITFLWVPLYLIYADPKVLLIVQAVVVALGALPAFWLARDTLRSDLAGLAFAAAYLLHPGLQGAVLFEYHGVTLAAPFLLFALYYLRQRRHVLFLVFAVLAMSTKENIPLVVIAMGFYQMAIQRELRWGLAATILGGLWFAAVLGVVMPAFNIQGRSPHWYLYQDLGGGVRPMLVTMVTNPGHVLQVLLLPERLSYVRDMLAPLGFLSPLGLFTFLISAPSWGVNLLSAASDMHTMGLRQYHAELVPVLVASAIAGAGLLVAGGERLRSGWGRPVLWLVLLWMGGSMAIGQYQHGFTPLRPGFHWLELTDHHRAAQDVMALIPPDAVVAASHELLPQLTKRKELYEFRSPSQGDFEQFNAKAATADYIIVDVLRHGWGDDALKLHQEVTRFIAEENFGVIAGKDGVLLLRRGDRGISLPKEFFSFAKANSSPTFPLSIRFGNEFELLGFDIRPGTVLNDTSDTVLVAGYWRLLKPTSDMYLPSLYFDTAGSMVGARGHPPGLVWYPTSEWVPGETVKVDYWPPIYLGNLSQEIELALGVARGENEWAPSARLTPQLRLPEEAYLVVPGQNQVRVASIPQKDLLPGTPRLLARPRLSSPPATANPISVDFQGELSLVGYEIDPAGVGPDGGLDFTLYWQAQREMKEAYTVFTHLYDGEGRIRAQLDGEPVRGGYPTTFWRPGEVVADRRRISGKALSPGEYTLEVGVYLPASGRRLQAASGGKQLPEGRAIIQKIVVP